MTIGISGIKVKVPSGKTEIAGRVKRYVEKGDCDVIELAAQAGRELLSEQCVARDSIDMVLFGGSGLPDRWIWSPSAKLQFLLGIPNAPSFDVFNGCSSLHICLRIAISHLIASGKEGRILILLADQLSKVGEIQNTDHSDLWSFGDSSAALLVDTSASQLYVTGQSLLTDGRFYDDIWYDPVAQRTVLDSDPDRNRALSLAYLKNYPKQIIAAAKDAGIETSDIKQILMNQGSPKTIESTEVALGLKNGAILRTFQEFGHIGSSDVLLGLDILLKSNMVKTGDYVAMASSSVGYSWGCTILRV